MSPTPDELPEPFRRVLMETIPCAVVALDAENRVIYWNRSAAELTGYGAEDMLGADCERLRMHLAPEQDRAVLEALCPFGSPGGFEEECQIRRKDGRTVPVVRKARAVRDVADRVVGHVYAMVDVSVIKQARSEIDRLKEQAARAGRYGALVGSSAAMRKLYEAVSLVAPTDASVVVSGETGTGKERVARTLHAESARSEGPFLAVNCGALPDELLAAELFGHARGAFTGATAERAGRFEAAEGGTLFLDEVGELSPASQVKLLRAVQEREITRVGENAPRAVDVRIVAATNRDLAAMIREGGFREDLYYRLRVVELHVPPLRQRKEDIPDLVAHFIDEFNRRYDKTIEGCSAAALAQLTAFQYPGNVRQLRHALEHAFVVTPRDVRLIEPEALPPELSASAGEAASARPPADLASPPPAPQTPAEEAEQVRAALAAAGGNKTRAAAALGITRGGLYKKLKRLGMV